MPVAAPCGFGDRDCPAHNDPNAVREIDPVGRRRLYPPHHGGWWYSHPPGSERTALFPSVKPAAVAARHDHLDPRLRREP